MRALGAIPFCKTNMPQSMMLPETANNIHGSTRNPFIRLLSSGGAAGGMIYQADIRYEDLSD
jgi:amidase